MTNQMELYVILACVPEDKSCLPCICGVFSTLNDALQKVRGLKGQEFYEGEYEETEYDEDFGYIVCSYKPLDDWYEGTNFTIERWTLNTFEDPSF